MAKMTIFVSERTENKVGKGENAGYYTVFKGSQNQGLFGKQLILTYH